MTGFSLGPRLPSWLRIPLFGDRKRYGLHAPPDDPCWIAWQERYQDHYEASQKRSFGKVVSDAGYPILAEVDLTDQEVLEIGPGAIPHLRFWRGMPKQYTIADVKELFLEQSMAVLQEHGVPCRSQRLEPTGLLPFETESVDILISFYALEHIDPLDEHLQELIRVLKPGGLLVGGIPCEGGLAWGVGRFLTTRRRLKKTTTINPDKVICWEHPNFAEPILQGLEARLSRRTLQYWPFRVPLVDANLIVRFIYQKS